METKKKFTSLTKLAEFCEKQRDFYIKCGVDSAFKGRDGDVEKADSQAKANAWKEIAEILRKNFVLPVDVSILEKSITFDEPNNRGNFDKHLHTVLSIYKRDSDKFIKSPMLLKAFAQKLIKAVDDWDAKKKEAIEKAKQELA